MTPEQARNVVFYASGLMKALLPLAVGEPYDSMDDDQLIEAAWKVVGAGRELERAIEEVAD